MPSNMCTVCNGTPVWKDVFIVTVRTDRCALTSTSPLPLELPSNIYIRRRILRFDLIHFCGLRASVWNHFQIIRLNLAKEIEKAQLAYKSTIQSEHNLFDCVKSGEHTFIAYCRCFGTFFWHRSIWNSICHVYEKNSYSDSCEYVEPRTQ